MRIFKFGGASVKNAEGVINLKKIVNQYDHKHLVIVVSAMGKTTNLLEALVEAYMNEKPVGGFLDELKAYHNDICLELLGKIPERVENWYILLTDYLAEKRIDFGECHDHIVCFGELLSTTIVYEYIILSQDNIRWMDARNLIRTNSIYTEANVDWQLTQHLIKRDLAKVLETGVVITQGYIGADFTGKTTTLGREGSDYSGAVFAYSLDAESLTVWKDVPGLLNADPKIFPNAEVFDALSFQEVTELTYYGAKVIHPKTIRPLAQKNIPLYVRSFLDIKAKGTKVSNIDKVASIPCYVFKENQTLVTLRVSDISLMDEKKLVKIFQSLDEANIKINLMHTSALTFSFCMDQNELKLNKASVYLKNHFDILYNDCLSLATIKNYNQDSFKLLPAMKEMIMEQKTRNNYQVIYSSLDS